MIYDNSFENLTRHIFFAILNILFLKVVRFLAVYKNININNDK